MKTNKKSSNRSKIIKKRNAFTEEEDKMLSNLVGRFGEDNWNKIARRMPKRDVRQCRERWLNYLSPLVINGAWSKEEEELLVRKVNEYGRKWKFITQFFPGRTDINIKNRYNCLIKYQSKKKQKEIFTDEMYDSFMIALLFENGGQSHDELW